MLNLLTIMLLGVIYGCMRMPNRQTVSCEIEERTIYLALNEKYELGEEGFESDDPLIAEVVDGTIVGKSKGETIISSSCVQYKVNVSDLYTDEKLEMNKEYLKPYLYSEEENRYLDEVLSYLIDKAGYQTRAGAVEAARFLLLRFPYKLKYFYENGRLTSETDVADGEGRYYHYGLYLSKYKQKELSVIQNGPAVWGEDMFDDYTETYNQNGLDCSGFITWALYNAGFDPQDIGAGPSEDKYDLTDIGEKVAIEDLDIDMIKTGDLVGLDGHVGMVIGKDDQKIYIGEMYWVKDLQVRIFTYEEFLNDSPWEYVMVMDEFYQADGNLSDSW